MDLKDELKMTLEFRKQLIEKGKQVNFENPDNLDTNQLIALTEKIFSVINEIDVALGYPEHPTGLTKPRSVSKKEQSELFHNFLDWYEIVSTPNQYLYQYVIKHYPKSKYSQILCVGDGENCYLGRKLAMKGYKVISIDPIARREFSEEGMSEDGEGMLCVVKDKFSKDSKGLIDWANLVVGVKVPMCVPDLVNLPKPTAFSISANPEIYNMSFKGTKITSAQQFKRLIERCTGIRVFTPEPAFDGHEMHSCEIFIHDGRQRVIGE